MCNVCEKQPHVYIYIYVNTLPPCVCVINNKPKLNARKISFEKGNNNNHTTTTPRACIQYVIHHVLVYTTTLSDVYYRVFFPSYNPEVYNIHRTYNNNTSAENRVISKQLNSVLTN